MFTRPAVFSGGPNPRELNPGDILGGAESVLAGGVATVGAGTWTGPAIASGIIRRTGPGAGYVDTTATAAQIIAAIAGNAPTPDVLPGSTFRMRFINTVAFAMTFAAGVGVIAGTGTLDCAASLYRDYLWTIINPGPTYVQQANTTNLSAVVTFVLPSGMSALPIGPAPNAVNITPGMSVTGTGIAAGTTVLGLTHGQGGLIGVTLSANATATSAAGGVALTFGPTVQIDALGGGNL